MRISEIIGRHMSFSFEVFPPKLDQPVEPLLKALDRLYAFAPDFISCTYGAGGTNRGRSIEVVQAIKNSGRAEPLVHFTCVGNSCAGIAADMAQYVEMGIENVLALRGDFPAGWEGTRGDFKHADALIAHLKKLHPDLCVSGACYIEKHISAESVEADIARVRSKQDCGAEYLMTQLCYDVAAYERFLARIRRAGVHLPVVVGVMPVLKRDGLIRMTLNNGCSIPSELAALVGKYGDNPDDFAKAGKAFTVELIHRYINAGIDGLHLYTLNRSEDVAEIIEASGVRPVR